MPVDSGWVLLTAATAAAGLFALFRRLRADFDPSISLFVIVLLAMATPLFRAIFSDTNPAGVLAFSVAAFGSYLASRKPLRQTQSLLLLTVAALLALVLTRTRDVHASLFTASSGFLALWPLVYVAVAGACATARRHVAETTALLLTLMLFGPLHASPLPVLAFSAAGLAAVFEVARRRPLIAATPLVLAFVCWNYWLMVQYTAGTIPKDAPFGFAAMVRQQADVHTRGAYVYPFAIPGNMIAAWQQGIPLGRYDALSAEPLRETFELHVDRSADPFLLEGWGAAGANASGPFRPIAVRASVLVPLGPVSTDVEIEVAFTAPSGATPELAIELNGAPAGTLVISDGKPQRGRLRIPADRVGTIFRTGYNRLSIVNSAATRLAIHRLRIAPAA